MLLYYITDRQQLGEDEASRRAALLHKVAEAAKAGVNYIQLRERDLPSRELFQLASAAVATVRGAGSTTRLLINSRIDVALAAGADGVHLRSDDLKASEARAVWAKAASGTNCVIAQSCHTLMNVLNAEAHGADFVVVGPIFGKQGSDARPIGVEELARITGRGSAADPKVEAGQFLRMPVLGLGGVSLENVGSCIRAGAAGVAAIRMFQERNIAEAVTRLRLLE